MNVGQTLNRKAALNKNLNKRMPCVLKGSGSENGLRVALGRDSVPEGGYPLPAAASPQTAAGESTEAVAAAPAADGQVA